MSDLPPDVRDTRCSCDGPGPQGEHRDWCELGHPNHECDPRVCRFAVRCDGFGIGTPEPCVLTMGHPGECEA